MGETDEQAETRVRAVMPEESTIDLDVHARRIAATVAAARGRTQELADDDAQIALFEG